MFVSGECVALDPDVVNRKRGEAREGLLRATAEETAGVEGKDA